MGIPMLKKFIPILSGVFLVSLIIFCYLGGQASMDTLISVPVLGLFADVYMNVVGHAGTGKVANFVYASMGAEVVCIWSFILYCGCYYAKSILMRYAIEQQPSE